jgi:Cohesin domain
MKSNTRRNHSRTSIVLLGFVLAFAPVPAVSAATLSTGGATGSPGQTVTITISLDNDVPVRAFQLRLTDVPDMLALVAGSARTTARSAGLVADANEQADGSVVAVLLSTGAALIASGSGPVMEIDFTISPLTVPGIVMINLSDVAVADENRMPLSVDTENGGVVVALPTATPTPTSTPMVSATPSFTATSASPAVTATPTNPPLPTSTNTPAPTGTNTSLSTATPTRTPTKDPTLVACVGNCNADPVVSIDELVRGLNIALGVLPLDACGAFDANGDGRVTVDELVNAISNALYGCGVAPPTSTPTATLTRTATTTATVTSTRTASVTSTATRIPTFTPTPTINPRCASIAGTWTGTETGSVTCSGGGESQTIDIDSPGSVTIIQKDCDVSYQIPGTDFIRSGTVNGNTFHVEGACLDESQLEGCTFSKNVTASDGTIQGTTISATGRCTVNGVCDGIAVSCSGSTAVTLTRVTSKASRAALRGAASQEPAPLLPGTREPLHLGLMTVVH